MLTSDCGSDVLVGAEKDELWDWNHCACHCLNIAVQAALKEPMVEGCLASLKALASRFSYSWSTWNRFKKTQLKILKWAEERSDDESDANYGGDEDSNVGGEGQPCLKANVAIVETRANTLELHVLHHKTSVGAEGFASDFFKFGASPQW